MRMFTDIVNNPEDASNVFPLPKDHWINKELEDRNGKTLLLEAISLHRPEFVETLLKAGARADLYNHELGTAPLHQAVINDDLGCTKLLLEGVENNKADVNQTDKAGRCALHHAVDHKHVDIIDYLLSQKNIDMNVKDKKGGQTPLYLAVKNKSNQIVEILISNGASSDVQCFGKSIHQHILEKLPGFDLTNIKIVKAPIIRQDSNSVLERMAELLDTAAHLKMKQEMPPETLQNEFRSLAIQCDTNSLNTFKSSGLSLLQKCAAGNLDKFADDLLSEGADPNRVAEESSSSAVHLAAFRGHVEVLQVLKHHNADFTVVNQTGETVLHRILVKDENFAEDQLEQWLY